MRARLQGARLGGPVAFVVLLVSGCTLLNRVERDLLPPPDGGIDAPVDAPFDVLNDLTSDGPPRDREMDACARAREICDDSMRVDEDCDGLRNCSDFDCAGHAACCMSGTSRIESWEDPGLTGWQPLPMSAPRSPRVQDNRLVFLGDSWVSVRRDACTPLASGVEIDVKFHLERVVTGCGSTPHRACVASLVLTPALDVVPGRRLLADLAVEVTVDPSMDNSRLQVRRETEVIGSVYSGAGLGHVLAVTVRLSPDVDARGRPVLAAEVLGTNESMAGEGFVLVERTPLLPVDELVRDYTECDRSPGLFVALEGTGDGVRVGQLVERRLDCTNPVQFRRPSGVDDAVLDAERLGFVRRVDGAVEGWASGGIAAPALMHTEPSSGTYRWDVLVDGTDVDRPLEHVADIGFAIGHATSTAWNGAWMSTPPPAPRAGDCHPSCVGPPAGACVSMSNCASGLRILREPSFALSSSPANFVYAIAQRNVGEPYRIRLLDTSRSAATSIGGFNDPLSLPEDCENVRDPMIVARGTGSTGSGFAYLLFYTCERDGAPSQIRVAGISAMLGATIPSDGGIVLDPASLPAYARGGVRAPEVIADYDEMGRGSFLMWFTARSARGSTVIALARGESEPGQLPRTFTPYPGNPVLRHDEPALGPCHGECEVLGLGVTRRANAPSTVRLLVSRRVSTATGVRYELVPLEQTWPRPWD
ncbi:MAG: hypothetical protein NZ898_09405 [Myxococcota bacterium]|nr:hypothetical protein [Myxococcota bacterium]MDW8362797.1 hypothetical protein [Myxococcales bacterium]